MNNKSEEYIKTKIAIALRVLHNRNKEKYKGKTDTKEDVSSYEKIALNSTSDMRKATVTSAFDGHTRSAMTTVILIIESMGYNLFDFAQEYDKITDEDIDSFTQEYLKEKIRNND